MAIDSDTPIKSTLDLRNLKFGNLSTSGCWLLSQPASCRKHHHHIPSKSLVDILEAMIELANIFTQSQAGYSLGVLLVSQVWKRCRVEIFLGDATPALPELLLLLVLPNEGVSESEEEDEFQAVANENRTNTKGVFGCLLRLVELPRGQYLLTCL